MPEGLEKIKVSLRKHNHSLVNWVQIPETMNQRCSPHWGHHCLPIIRRNEVELENKEYAG